MLGKKPIHVTKEVCYYHINDTLMVVNKSEIVKEIKHPLLAESQITTADRSLMWVNIDVERLGYGSMYPLLDNSWSLGECRGISLVDGIFDGVLKYVAYSNNKLVLYNKDDEVIANKKFRNNFALGVFSNGWIILSGYTAYIYDGMGELRKTTRYFRSSHDIVMYSPQVEMHRGTLKLEGLMYKHTLTAQKKYDKSQIKYEYYLRTDKVDPDEPKGTWW